MVNEWTFLNKKILSRSSCLDKYYLLRKTLFVVVFRRDLIITKKIQHKAKLEKNVYLESNQANFWGL